ncbi:penicillin-binding protein 2 [Aquabacterium humicola]|uniref:penicillin-binding protein 2 n=1 Tax=Aquabacterium humicola TaxID=3237377 RepID=UPI002542FD3F|nr:penicillin-binding protein 2 [Rubrivivax pictus]
MTEIKDLERELSRFRGRLVAAALFVLLCFGLLAARLTWLQVVRHEELQTQAEANRIAVVPIVPNRGLIVDRNGLVLATNYSAYTLEITPSKVEAELDPMIDQLGALLEIQPRDRRRFKRLLEESKSFESLPIRTKLTDEEVARFMAQRFRFPGVDVRARLFRNYPEGEAASHLLGYIGRINAKEKAAMEEWDEETQGNYRGTDYIGKLGLEQSYERELHGITGFEEVETSAGGRAVRRLRSHPSTPGNTLVLSVDMRLQQLVERLYGDRRGALVALDPHTGEVLSFVSKPTFDPNLFVDGIDVDSWRELNESIDKPLLNRALRGLYPPGSTYKPFMALVGLATGKRTPQQGISDPGYFMFGNHRFRDDKEGGHGWVDMYRSIVHSCDTYYYVLASELGVDLMAEQLAPFGFGQLTGIDLEGEVKGILPSTSWKKRAYRKPEQQRWYAGETISLGIGQGYNSYTVLQMAQALGILATGGERHKPHLVREVVDVVHNTRRPVGKEPFEPVPIKPEHLAEIRRALVGVNVEGTSATAFRGAGYTSAGKTGTAQVVTIKQNEKYNAAKMAEHLRDHALYVAYAPADNPKIAVALVVENAGFGAQNAAPIARRIFDYWLMGLYPTEEDIAAVQQGQAPAPLKPPRRIADVAFRSAVPASAVVPAAASVPAAGSPIAVGPVGAVGRQPAGASR